MEFGASHLICSLVDSKSTCNLRSSTSIHHTVVFDEVTDYAQCIVESTLGLFDDLLRWIKRLSKGVAKKGNLDF